MWVGGGNLGTVCTAFAAGRPGTVDPHHIWLCASHLQVNLPEAIARGRRTKCSRCGERGATLKCWHQQCMQQFHLPCARLHSCTLVVSAMSGALGEGEVLLGQRAAGRRHRR